MSCDEITELQPSKLYSIENSERRTAVQELTESLEKLGWNLADIEVTDCPVDTKIPPLYKSVLAVSYKYLKDGEQYFLIVDCRLDGGVRILNVYTDVTCIDMVTKTTHELSTAEMQTIKQYEKQKSYYYNMLYSELIVFSNIRIRKVENTLQHFSTDEMDNEALNIILDYAKEHLDKSDAETTIAPYIVWKSKILKNWKYLISTNLYDGMYYELTFNGDSNEWYLDAYKKFDNKVIPKNRNII